MSKLRVLNNDVPKTRSLHEKAQQLSTFAVLGTELTIIKDYVAGMLALANGKKLRCHPNHRASRILKHCRNASCKARLQHAHCGSQGPVAEQDALLVAWALESLGVPLQTPGSTQRTPRLACMASTCSGPRGTRRAKPDPCDLFAAHQTTDVRDHARQEHILKTVVRKLQGNANAAVLVKEASDYGLPCEDLQKDRPGRMLGSCLTQCEPHPSTQPAHRRAAQGGTGGVPRPLTRSARMGTQSRP